MAQKKNPNLMLMEPSDIERRKKKRRKHRRIRLKKVTTAAILASMVLLGTYLLLTNHLYHTVYETASYKRETSNNNRYAAFRNGIIRYSKNGVTYLNRRNEVIWIQPAQFQNPVIDISGQTFAVADSGGNSVQVFTEEGLKGSSRQIFRLKSFRFQIRGL